MIIDPKDLHHWWPMVEEGVLYVSQMGDGWRPEDVYAAVRYGHSTLHVVVNDGRCDGFFVLTPTRNRWTNLPELHVWIAYSNDDPEVFKAGQEEIERCANGMGASKIVFTSPRKGWERRLPGYKPGLMLFEKRLGD